MKKHISYFLVAFLYFSLCSCNDAEKKVFTEKKITVPANGTISIKEIDLSVTNHGCGREWYNTDGEHSSERPYCELLIRYKDSTKTFSQGFGLIFIGDVEILVDKINPWGREEDSVPPGGCELIVRRSSAMNSD